MTYSTGLPIRAADYNTFATLAGGMNDLFADNHIGSTTLPDAGLGYGQVPALTAEVADTSITAAKWASLFDTIRKVGAHQGTTIVPPLPVTDPVIGDKIAAYNTPASMSTLIALLHTNKFNLAIGQSTLTTGTSYSQPPAVIPWTNTLTFNFQVDFGSWNNARYFFNSGGKLQLNGSYSPSVTPEDAQWISMLTDMSPLIFNYNSTAPNVGSGGTAIGFYELTTSLQSIYHKIYGSGIYSASFIDVSAKLANPIIGTDGIIDFVVELVDNEAGIKNPKNGTTIFRVDNTCATGANVAYPGTLTISTVGANTGYIST